MVPRVVVSTEKGRNLPFSVPQSNVRSRCNLLKDYYEWFSHSSRATNEAIASTFYHL
ncbi:hypothetical protein Bcell_3785 [Evansella cellulosilytica DSM 2522]|uniref:Uncharacterized protein n=1 Tax=Evansella cellulosilytica (strain ATCC 21833 / DSM 2522 / FERM P-1141 / JCM 9156 / N-4) TaxID=649639 RepID=E6TTZ4_EVAC2|nr:hypothetical protein Bcell_3785 [Evansella cellulosilytica DSM 2522]